MHIQEKTLQPALIVNKSKGIKGKDGSQQPVMHIQLVIIHDCVYTQPFRRDQYQQDYLS